MTSKAAAIEEHDVEAGLENTPASTNPRDYVLGNETFESKGGLTTTDQKVTRAANLETELQKMHSAGLGIRMNSEFVVSC